MVTATIIRLNNAIAPQNIIAHRFMVLPPFCKTNGKLTKAQIRQIIKPIKNPIIFSFRNADNGLDQRPYATLGLIFP